MTSFTDGPLKSWCYERILYQFIKMYFFLNKHKFDSDKKQDFIVNIFV